MARAIGLSGMSYLLGSRRTCGGRVTEGTFSVEADRVTAASWSAHLETFADANLYQTWAYGVVRWGERNLSHLVLTRGGRTVAMAQLVMAGPRRIRAGIAYLRWGPLWRPKGEEDDVAILARMGNALRDEYVRRRGLYLRVLPGVCIGTRHGAAFETAFTGYRSEPFKRGESYRTLIVDLAPSLEVLRKNLDQKWRNQLNRAEKNGLVVREGDTPDDFAAYIAMHDEMLARKRFSGASDVREFARMQRLLPAGQKMHIMICEDAGIPVAGLVATTVGDTGVYLLGATTDQGMKAKGAYLLQWRMIQRLKAQGAVRYDLNGINPGNEPRCSPLQGRNGWQ